MLDIPTLEVTRGAEACAKGVGAVFASTFRKDTARERNADSCMRLEEEGGNIRRIAVGWGRGEWERGMICRYARVLFKGM